MYYKKTMSKRFLATLLIIGLGLVGIFWISRDKANAPNDNSAQTLSSEHVQGAGKKGVTLVEFGDFQCPACGAYYPIVKQVKAKYGDDITFQFRHFPLTQIHPNAFAAHRAAEAAGLQNKFFEMHDMLYERQNTWVGASNVVKILEDYATELGLNIEKFKQDFSSGAVNDVINKDVKAAQGLKATSTPTFVLDGKKLEQLPRDAEGFSKLIDEAIAQKSQNQTPDPPNHPTQ